jgi:hypothetical protein
VPDDTAQIVAATRALLARDCLELPGRKAIMARREGFEPPTLRFEVSRKGKK